MQMLLAHSRCSRSSRFRYFTQSRSLYKIFREGRDLPTHTRSTLLKLKLRVIKIYTPSHQTAKHSGSGETNKRESSTPLFFWLKNTQTQTAVVKKSSRLKSTSKLERPRETAPSLSSHLNHSSLRERRVPGSCPSSWERGRNSFTVGVHHQERP